MWEAYFATCGLMLLVYPLLRLAIWDINHYPEPKEPDPHASPGKPIDALSLAKRLDQVKRDYTGELPIGPMRSRKCCLWKPGASTSPERLTSRSRPKPNRQRTTAATGVFLVFWCSNLAA